MGRVQACWYGSSRRWCVDYRFVRLVEGCRHVRVATPCYEGRERRAGHGDAVAAVV